MQPEALKFIETEPVCVLAIEMMDGSPHAATVHFAHAVEPLRFVFLTESRYRKAEPLFGRDSSRASVVVGTTENKSNMATLQMDGIATRLTPEDKALQEVYFAKFLKKRAKFTPPDDFFFKFTPTWWRFTDWRGADGKKIYTSN